MREKVLGILMLLLVLTAFGAWVMVFRTCYRLSNLRNTKPSLLHMEGKPVGALAGWVVFATPVGMLASMRELFPFVVWAIWMSFPFICYLRVRSRWKRETGVKP